MAVRKTLGFTAVLLMLITLGVPLFIVKKERREEPLRASPEAVLRLSQSGQLPVTVFVAEDGGTRVLPLEEYVKGVVAAEMPAAYELEALKAQAVVARTYAVAHMRVFGGSGCRSHPEADVCTNPEEGQAWVPREEMRRRWGVLAFPGYWRKVERAVEETRGLIVVHDHRPIDAVYHAASGGRTEDAVYVWGRSLPYLVSVASPYEEPAKVTSQVVLSWDELAIRTGVPLARLVALERRGEPVVEVVERTPSGRAARVRVGEKEFTGPEFRKALGLRSTLLTVRPRIGGIEVQTIGYGHGVGMSQAGANGLARQGRDFRAIIRHYYSGADVRPIFVE